MKTLFMLADATEGGQIEQIARTFGVDWAHLVAQIISFCIVCVLLHRFAYRPVLAMLEERRQRIAEGLANAEKIWLVIKGAEVMSAVEPTLVGVLVTFQAVIVHHQGFGGNKISRRGSRQRWKVIFLAFFRAGDIPFARVLGVKKDHRDHEHANRSGPAEADSPFNPRPGQPVQQIQPNCQNGREHMGPISDRA